MTEKIIKDRLAQLRQSMQQQGLYTYVIPTADPHLSEYIAAHWQLRKWMSGFTGSAGTLVVTMEEAGLWTDSRYFLQAADQLKETGIELHKEGQPGVLPYPAYLCKQMQGKTVGLDGRLFAAAFIDRLSRMLALYNIKLKADAEMADLWSDRPALPASEVFVHEEKYAGTSAMEKLDKVRADMQKIKATHCLVSALDEVAYALNLRASDVEYNPVFYAYLLIAQDGATLYADTAIRHLNEGKLADYFAANSIKVAPYDQIAADLKVLSADANNRLWVDKQKTNFVLADIFDKSHIIDRTAPFLMMKAVKNETEIETLRQAQLVDGVALTQAFCWLDRQLDEGKKVTELSFADHLDACRAAQKDYFSLSFNTISGFAAHGAIVHYGVTPETDIPLEKGNFLLVDSGGNYLTGTTDITRTVFLGGNAPAQHKHDYTLVLKGHIALGSAKFAKGMTGSQLDVLARQFLWEDGKDYGHGTGHGIGHFLCVHEGPQRISPAQNMVALQPGMFISNEPGLYLTGQYGIRIENMVCVQPFVENEFGTLYQFETMSYFPFDLFAIDVTMLTQKEKDWINAYHTETYRRITSTGLLTDEETAWLKKKTALIF